MYVVVARFQARAGSEDEVAATLTKVAAISMTEPGCLLYTVNRALDDPRSFLLYEQYRDRAAFDAHLATPAFKDLIVGTVTPQLERNEAEYYELVPAT